jgi:predicted transcriptional regulator
MFYNTTNEKGEELKDFLESNNTQDGYILGAILDIGEEFSPRDLSKIFPSTPVTSIRRSLNTLLNKGFIEKTGNKVEGIYNRPETQYKLVNK